MNYYAPLDPDCPVVERFICAISDDPMTQAYGAPLDDIIEGFERKHRKSGCQRCIEYGCANIEVR
jgi:hypothetical protein